MVIFDQTTYERNPNRLLNGQQMLTTDRAELLSMFSFLSLLWHQRMPMTLVDEPLYGKIRFNECCCSGTLQPNLTCRLDGILVRAGERDSMHRIMKWLL